jgi:hypothetical protein
MIRGIDPEPLKSLHCLPSAGLRMLRPFR